MSFIKGDIGIISIEPLPLGSSSHAILNTRNIGPCINIHTNSFHFAPLVFVPSLFLPQLHFEIYGTWLSTNTEHGLVDIRSSFESDVKSYMFGAQISIPVSEFIINLKLLSLYSQLGIYYIINSTVTNIHNYKSFFQYYYGIKANIDLKYLTIRIGISNTELFKKTNQPCYDMPLRIFTIEVIISG